MHLPQEVDSLASASQERPLCGRA
ncbi:hypothetical protein U0070_021598 [Myodes glareolus]|uniref:Uncharacterized protein n=1 Tax=Myodes glareolus TaxID=447135 RepID=A0AAW0IE45_MYOGA